MSIGPRYRGLCPFHKEKNPSFFLRPINNRYVCYGCGERGGPLLLDDKFGGKIYQDIVQKARLEDVPSSVLDLYDQRDGRVYELGLEDYFKELGSPPGKFISALYNQVELEKQY